VGIVVGALESPSLEPFRVSAIDFISQLIRFAPESLNAIDIGELAHAVVEFCKRFPNQGIGVRSALRLAIFAIRTRQMSDSFLDVLLPFCVEFIGVDFGALRPFAIDCAKRIFHLAEEDVELAERIARRTEFIELCEPAVHTFEEALEQDYGGLRPCVITHALECRGLPLQRAAALHASEIVVK
jgi:hypothetical protein